MSVRLPGTTRLVLARLRGLRVAGRRLGEHHQPHRVLRVPPLPDAPPASSWALSPVSAM